MKKRLWTPLFMLMQMVLGSFFFAFKPAAAQTGTTVFFSPDPANVYLNISADMGRQIALLANGNGKWLLLTWRW